MKASDILKATIQQEPQEQGLLERFFNAYFARQAEMNLRRRERQDAAALQGLAELKRQNESFPTAKRTEAIRQYEERLRKDGLLK